MKIRKQVYELTSNDLREYPIWEFASDEEEEEGQDEATVRPWKGPEPLDPSSGMFVVRAEFTLGDGSRLVGYLAPPGKVPPSIGIIQPTVTTESAQVAFWCGAKAPTAERLAKAYATLGKEAKAVFPCRYSSDVGLTGGPVSGELRGFIHYRSIQDRTVIEIQ